MAPSSNVKNLGVVFEFNLSLSDHVSLTKLTRAHTRDLYRIRHLLDLKMPVLLANVLASSKLD